MVGNGEIETKQTDEGADQAFGLTQGQAEHGSQGQGCRDGQRRVAQGCPPRVVRGSARQAAIAASVNQIVRLPRARRAASYSAQLVTRCRCFGM
jgi:hypothetical protein